MPAPKYKRMTVDGQQIKVRTAGGNRPGAGRPTEAPTKVLAFRVDLSLAFAAKKKYPKTLKYRFIKWLQSIALF